MKNNRKVRWSVAFIITLSFSAIAGMLIITEPFIRYYVDIVFAVIVVLLLGSTLAFITLHPTDKRLFRWSFLFGGITPLLVSGLPLWDLTTTIPISSQQVFAQVISLCVILLMITLPSSVILVMGMHVLLTLCYRIFSTHKSHDLLTRFKK